MSMGCHVTHDIVFDLVDRGVVGFAQSCRTLDDCLKDSWEIGRRACDDLQDLRGRRLLLQRLSQSLFRLAVDRPNAVNISFRLRRLRTKTGNAFSALRPLARQVHLVGKLSPGNLTEQHDELAPLDHSITSSARARSDGGTLRPSALAVVRLMVKSNVVGCSTGMSAGLVPCKTLSTSSAARRNVSGKFAP